LSLNKMPPGQSMKKATAIDKRANSLGIPLSAAGRWARAERSPEQSSPAQKTVLNLTDRAELTRLRRENEQLRREREILKKAAVFFAKEVE